MHIGIDLGYQESKIAYRQDGIWEYQIMPPFSLAQASGDGADEVALVNKLASLYLQAIKDTDATVIISYPNYWGMTYRHRLFQLCQSAFKGQSYCLLPGSFAALWGSATTSSLSGHVLIIDMHQESRADFSLLTINQAGQNICLECQLPMESTDKLDSALQTFIGSKLRQRAERLGFYDSGLWKLDAVVLLSPAAWLDHAAPLVERCFANIKLVIPEKAEFQIARGLARWGEMGVDRPRLRMIYPFRFALEIAHPDQTGRRITQLPFDTANLALDLAGRYRIATLLSQSNSNLSTADHEVHYRLLETSDNGFMEDELPLEPELIWEFNGNCTHTPNPLAVYFNTREFIIEADSLGEIKEDDQARLPDLASLHRKSGQRLLTIPFLHPQLKKDLQILVEQPNDYDLETQLELTRLRLLTLLQLT
jgi:hypothetical protein